MKKLILATAFGIAASAALAGSYNPPVVDEAVIVEDAASSTGVSWIVPSLTILFLLAIFS